MSASLLWMIVGLLLLIIELFSMTFFLMWIATAALLTALVALFIPLAWLQWLFMLLSFQSAALFAHPCPLRWSPSCLFAPCCPTPADLTLTS
jgi:membrane protein implicated in regulation of membrane protease activity